MQTRQEQPTNRPSSSKAYQGPCAFEFVSAQTGSWRLERPEVAFAACIKCGTCKMYCPTNVITIDKEAEECVTFLWDFCKGCGICANVCPKKCIQMVPEGRCKIGAL